MEIKVDIFKSDGYKVESLRGQITLSDLIFSLNCHKLFACSETFTTFVSFLDETLNVILNTMEVKEKYFTDTQEKLARYGKALGNPVRIFILDYLAANINKCCYSGDMAEELPIARSTLSEHLKELKKAGLIQGEINAPYIKYCLNKENWEEAKRIFSAFFAR